MSFPLSLCDLRTFCTCALRSTDELGCARGKTRTRAGDPFSSWGRLRYGLPGRGKSLRPIRSIAVLMRRGGPPAAFQNKVERMRKAVARGREELVEPRAVANCAPSLPGLEVWSFLNWLRGGVYSSPAFTLSTPMTTCIDAAYGREGRTRDVVTAADVLVTSPHDVVIVERMVGRQPNAGERTLTALVLSPEYLPPGCLPRPAFWKSNDAGISAGTELRRCIGVLEDPDAGQCEKEERVLSIVSRLFGMVAAASKAERKTVRLCREFIHDRVAGAFSLSEMASEVGVSKWHLNRVFRAEMGLAPGQYWRALRQQRALVMLRRGSVPATVAATLGFADQAHLTRELRGAYGITPGAYRRSLQGKGAR